MSKSIIAGFVALLALPLWSAPVDKFFDSDGVQIRYIEQGAGESVVLIHGFTGSAEDWLATGTFEKLAEHYRVIALDCRGHGKSDKPHDPKLYGTLMVQDVVRLLDHLHISTAHIVGYSMGGGIATKVVTLHPERCITATFGGASPRKKWNAESVRYNETLAAEIETGTLRSIILAVWPSNRPAPTEEQVQRQSTAYLRGNDPLALAAVLRSAQDLGADWTQFASVRVPLLGIAGTADPVFAELNEAKSLVPGLIVVGIEGASHDAIARPEFLETVEKFLAAHAASPNHF